MPDRFTYDVFLSHNSKDKLRVRKLAEDLRAAGVAGVVRRVGCQAGR